MENDASLRTNAILTPLVQFVRLNLNNFTGRSVGQKKCETFSREE